MICPNIRPPATFRSAGERAHGAAGERRIT